MTGESHWGRSFFGSLHFFTGFPVKRIGGLTGQSIEVSSDYASCLCLMRKISALPREWDTSPVSHWDVQYTLLYKKLCGKGNVVWTEIWLMKWTYLNIMSISFYTYLFYHKLVRFLSKWLHMLVERSSICAPPKGAGPQDFINNVAFPGPFAFLAAHMTSRYTVCQGLVLVHQSQTQSCHFASASYRHHASANKGRYSCSSCRLSWPACNAAIKDCS